MKKIRVEFQDENSTEFKVNMQGALTYRELLVLARALRKYTHASHKEIEGNPMRIDVDISRLGYRLVPQIKIGRIACWQMELVADEFYLAAQHIFFTQQNQAMVQAVRNQQAIVSASAVLRRKDTGLIIPGGRG